MHPEFSEARHEAGFVHPAYDADDHLRLTRYLVHGDPDPVARGRDSVRAASDGNGRDDLP
jgi:hypothetical protein